MRGNTPSGITGPVCVLANQFKRKENVIFRIRVLNAMGQPLDDKALKEPHGRTVGRAKNTSQLPCPPAAQHHGVARH